MGATWLNCCTTVMAPGVHEAITDFLLASPRAVQPATQLNDVHYKAPIITQLAPGELSEKRWILGTKWRPVGSPRRQSVTAWAFLMRMVGIWTQNGRFLGSNAFGKPIVPCTQGCQMSSKVRVGSTAGIDAMGGIATRGQAARRRFQFVRGSGANRWFAPLLDVSG